MIWACALFAHRFLVVSPLSSSLKAFKLQDNPPWPVIECDVTHSFLTKKLSEMGVNVPMNDFLVRYRGAIIQ